MPPNDKLEHDESATDTRPDRAQKSPSKPANKAAAREARLAEALRNNLRRRKARDTEKRDDE